MNPHDVLGIRPNASSQELELAYRSRRTQYHPDKYAQSDAETVLWATEKMQEVNAAYAELSDPMRSHDPRVDRAAEKGQTGAADQRAADPNFPSLAALLTGRLATTGGFERIFFAPHIPLKKLQAALGSYGHGISSEDVLALVDVTVFGGAKEGALLTESGIVSKELACSPSTLFWSNIREIDLRGTTIWLNGLEVVDCTMVDKAELNRLVIMLRSFLMNLHSVDRAASVSDGTMARAESDTPWADPALCQELFSAAKELLVAFSAALAPLEEQIGERWLDRPGLAGFFEAAGDALLDPTKAKLAYRYVLTVGMICEAAHGCLLSGEDNVDPALLVRSWNDPIQVQELRLVLARLIEVCARHRGNERAERFFGQS